MGNASQAGRIDRVRHSIGPPAIQSILSILSKFSLVAAQLLRGRCGRTGASAAWLGRLSVEVLTCRRGPLTLCAALFGECPSEP